MNRKDFIKSIGLAGICLGTANFGQSFRKKKKSKARAKPNMIIVLTDDHAWEAVSAYGGYLKNHAKTPVIDSLGEDGMRFDNFMCNNSICSPSRASFLTGQYSHKNGVKGLGGTINDSSPWYPEELQKAGYQTWLVGKWHLGGKIRGYDRHMTVKGQGKYFDPKFSGTEGVWEKKGYATDRYTDIALDWLENWDKKKPFLLCLQFKAPHHDYGHAERYNDLLKGVTVPEPPSLYEDIRKCDSNLKKNFVAGSKFHMDYARDGNYYERHKNDKAPNAMGKVNESSEKDRIRTAYQHQIHKYIRCINGNDDNLKRVLYHLDKEGLKEDTIVVYTADQGYWLGQHGFYDKRLILETSIRMPFLIRYPRIIKRGSVNKDICMNIDLAPTLIDIAGGKAPASMQGKTFLPLLKGETPKNWRKSSFYSYWGGEPNHYGIRTERYTYAHVAGHQAELFDRKKDPEQMHNVAGNPEYKPILERCEEELQKLMKEIDIRKEDLPEKLFDPNKKVKKKKSRNKKR